MAYTKVSPLAPQDIVDAPLIKGVRFATAAAGIKYKDRQDVLLVVLDKDTSVAGVFTTSKCPSAAVDWCRSALPSGTARALLVNSGNANAFTGARGLETTQRSAAAAASALQCKPAEVMLCSTGVIGEPLDAAKIENVMSALAQDAKSGDWAQAARAIMTTDTFPKVATAKSGAFNIVGIAKGAGMIAPDMATMLAFVFTDANISAADLQAMLSRSVTTTLNCVTVDSDTSTSDTLLAFATGTAGALIGGEAACQFEGALTDVLRDLAILIAKDGEGARKFITVDVVGASDETSAKTIASSIANSPLVKTAVAGEDANWGRVVMAIGKAGEPANRDTLTICFGKYVVAANGMRAADYDEAVVSDYMRGSDITISVDLQMGIGKARVWTCDLTKDYVAINGDYRS